MNIKKNTFGLLFLTFLINTITAQNIEPRIENILSNMTIDEKIGQMTQINITELVQDSILVDYNSITKYVLDTQKLIKWVDEFKIGSFLNGRAVPADNWVYVTNTIQSINAQYNDIPIIYGIDHVHGPTYVKEGTIFPHNISVACSFDTMHAYNTALVSARESSDLGHNWIFGPVLGLGKSKSWGRYYETYGEDPYLITKMGVATVNGLQNEANTAPYKTAACAKHFLGYSNPVSGWDRSPALIPDQELREFYLPQFKAAIEAGAKTIMINSGEINGIPVHASYDILTKLLREELGFKGLAVTDWLDVIALEKMHYVAENEKEATYQAVMAGIDMSMVATSESFVLLLRELVAEGRITEARLDESVRRILRVKLELGLFENVTSRRDRLSDRVATTENQNLARKAAEESIVLIKNEGDILPLNKDLKIVLAGPTADKKRSLCGGWTYRFAAKIDKWFPNEMHTLQTAMEAEFGDNLVFSDGENLIKNAEEADVIVLALGEPEPYAETQGTIDDLSISPYQQSLFDMAKLTGKPVVVVLIEGRPRLIPNMIDRVDGLIFAGLPGIFGGDAIANVISGDVNPSGKMSFSYPYKSGHIIPYNHKRSEFSQLREVPDALKRWSIAPFGHGESYTSFEYTDLKINAKSDGTYDFTVAVKNTGDRMGKEAVLWYVSDMVGSITRPVKALKYFEKQSFEAGQTKVFTYNFDPKIDGSFPDKDGNILIEEGEFVIEVGGKTLGVVFE